MKKPSERSESEKKSIETRTPVSDEQVPKNVMRELAKDEDFKEWAKEKPEKAHKVMTYAGKKRKERRHPLFRPIIGFNGRYLA